MKRFPAATWLALALLCAVACIPFSPLAKDDPDLFAIELEIAPSRGGNAQVYFDTGRGFNEPESAAVVVAASPAPATYRIPIRPGTYRQFRLDPIDSDAPVLLRSMRVVSSEGATVRTLPLASLVPVAGIARIERDDSGLNVVPDSGANDPQLLVALNPPLTLEVSWRTALPGDLRRFVLTFAIAAALLLGGRFLVRSSRAVAVRRWLGARPGWLLATIAAGAVIASSYPIVFLGKSLVSPNMGTVLLYERFPTLPGYTDATAGEVMGADIGAIMWQHVPLSMVQARALAQGELPIWNRYNSAGTPLLGQGQSMFGDPLHLLVLVTKGAAWAWDLKYLVAKWLFAFGLGLLTLHALASQPAASVGSVRTSVIAAAITTAAAPFIGFFVYRFNHPAYFSLCYAPWPLYCWLRAVAADRLLSTARWAGALILANLALMNSGTAKEAYMLLLAMNLTGAVVWLVQHGAWKLKLQQIAVVGWAGCLFVLLTAPIWGTFVHELRHAYTSYNSASAYQIQPSLILGLFDEIFYRPLMPELRTFNPSLSFLLLLGFVYFVATLRDHLRNRVVVGLAAASVLPLVLAFGVVPPSWITRVPFLANVVHVDNTFSCALLVLWGVLAGIGFHAALRRLGTEEGRSDIVIGAVILAVMVAAWIGFGFAVHRPTYGTAFTVNHLGQNLPVPAALWWYLTSLLIAAAIVILVARRVLRTGIFTATTVLVLSTGAAVLCWRHGLHAPGVAMEKYVLRPTTRVAFHAKSEAVSFVQSRVAQEPFRAYGLRGNFFPGWTAAYALETVHGPDALMNARYRELIGAIGGAQRIWDWRLYLQPNGVAAARPFFDFLNVRYYFDLNSDQALMRQTLRVAKLADLDVYESPTAWPRAFFTNQVFPYDRLEMLINQIRDGDGRPFAAMRRVDAAELKGPRLAWKPAARRVTPAHDYTITNNSTRFRLKADGPGVIVVSESFWPGDVRVFVNGLKQRPFVVNHAFIGAAIDRAGEYDVEVRYVPGGWYRNLGLCVTGLVLLGASIAVLVLLERRLRAGSGTTAVTVAGVATEG